jgi:hypothetical protein
VGSLNSLGIRLEEVRTYLQELRDAPDIDHDVAIRIHSQWSDDLVIRLAHLRKEMAFDYEGKKRNIILLDILWAVDFLDHMDTYGLAMTTKGYELRDESD